jgi:hypothetical protein
VRFCLASSVCFLGRRKTGLATYYLIDPEPRQVKPVDGSHTESERTITTSGRARTGSRSVGGLFNPIQLGKTSTNNLNTDCGLK